MTKEIISPDDNHGFADIIDQYDWDDTTKRAYAVTAPMVEAALAVAAADQRRLTPDEFMALISPAAAPYIEDMAALAQRFTLEKFGRTISMYIPMYVSNACANACENIYDNFNIFFHTNVINYITARFYVNRSPLTFRY